MQAANEVYRTFWSWQTNLLQSLAGNRGSELCPSLRVDEDGQDDQIKHAIKAAQLPHCLSLHHILHQLRIRLLYWTYLIQDSLLEQDIVGLGNLLRLQSGLV